MYILSLSQQYGWTKYHNGRWLADLNGLATWLQTSKAPVSKPLVDMEVKELSKTIVALEKMVFWKNKKG